MGGLRVLERAHQHLHRYREIAVVLAKHGLGDLLHTLNLDDFVEAKVTGLLHRHTSFDAISRPERVRRALEDLGPTFIKAGQYLSTRADLLSEEYLRELARLQEAVPPFPGEEARRIIEDELGSPVSKLFKSFSAKPFAAASIAQVHEAVLEDDARAVIKVQRPDIRRRVAVDLDIMARWAEFAEKHVEEWRWRRPTRILAEIAHSLDREMDLSLEASHAERFARQFAEDPTVYAPRVHRALSSSRVLTLELVEGVRPDDLKALEREGLDPRVVAENLARHYLSMIFVHGFFHADPHPGNLRVLPGHAIAYLDFGMMGRLDRPTREALAEVVLSVVERNEAALGKGLLSLADYGTEPDARAFQADVAELMDQYAYRPLSEWRLGRMLEQLFHTTSRHRVSIPAELFLMTKAVTELESLCRALDPGFDAVGQAAPFVRWVKEERLRPKRLAETFAEAGRGALELLVSAPSDIRELIRQARRGRLLIEFEHKGLEPALAELDQVSNRLSYAVLLASLVIGSALLIHARIPPYWQGISVLGLGGFLLSSLMALWLLAAILRHGRL